jgi:ferritin-like metal-binding protein YciE
MLAKATQLAHLRYAEYITLITAAELTGHTVVGVLLESTLADKPAFQERTQRLIQSIIEGKMAARMVA